MVSTFHGLELGKRGLMVGQASIATTGHNIANANTKGYSRQQVNTSASPSLNIWANGNVNPSQLGTGVSLDSITRVRDQFLDGQFRNQNGTLGEWSVSQETLDRLESIINEPSKTGLQSAMDQISSAWQDLENDPNSASAKAVLQERAQEFVSTAQAMYSSMTNLKTDLTQQTTAKIDEVNGYLEQIAALNQSIKRNGANSNDLLDKRDVLVEELSKIVSIKVEQQKDGTNNITLSSNGASLVSGINHTDIADQSAGTDGNKLFGGELAGITKSLETVTDYQRELTTTVEMFAGANGMSQDDATTTTENLFTKDAATFTIAGLSVNTTADKYTAPVNMEEDSKNAKKSFQTLVAGLGAKSQSATNFVANFEAALLATDSRRQSVTGVSLDEEMANLIKYQHSYSAAARMISTTDQMLDTIINRMAR
ncbi:flagellar hook-associated protein FlgK [Paenisporosarcina indica]|uniref:flagellar hook-associated protein FlgK n=1 Tax=Paenisporosarcina indica TaxID=650093 RepID=UPI00094FC816|nr:flagellar hook-associated protein FlgK [Paenisporosarcina indica]